MDAAEVYGEWRNVPGYEGELQVSSLGYVRQKKIVGDYWWPPKIPKPISRWINTSPTGHTVTQKQNAGWSFRRGTCN